MRLFKCNGCGKTESVDDDTIPINHHCGARDMVRICPRCKKEYDFTEQVECKYCKAKMLANQVVVGEIGLIDAMLKM